MARAGSSILVSMMALGICNVVTVRVLKAQIKGHHLDVIFLCGTKEDEERMEKVKRNRLASQRW